MFKWRMLPTEETAPPRLRDDYMFLTGCALLTGIVLYITGGLLRAFVFAKGESWHNRVELIGANVAHILTAGGLVAVVVALMHVGRENTSRVRPVAVIVVILAGIVVALSAYLVFDVLTRHISNSDSGDVAFAVTDSGSISTRLAAALPTLGA